MVLVNFASILVVLMPFYYGIYQLFSARLAIGRERVQARAWREAVAALEPFDAWAQRFLDGSGEAHFLLAIAYTGLGDKAKAEKPPARLSAAAKESGPISWSEWRGQNSRSRRGAGQENRPRPPKK